MICPKCSDEIPDTGPGLLLHLRQYHSDETDLNAKCPRCSVVCNTIPTLHKHWYSNHHVPKRPRKEEGASSSQPCKRACGNEDVSRVNLSATDSAASADFDSGLVMSVSNRQASSCEEFVLGSQITSESTSTSDDQPGNQSSSQEHVCLISETNSEMVVLSGESDSDSDQDEEGTTLSENAIDNNEEGISISSAIHRQISACQPQSSVNENAANFLLRLNSHCHVPETAASKVVLETEELIKSAISDFSCKVEEKLQEKNVDLNEAMDVQSLIKSSSKVFENLRNSKSQEKYFNECLGVNPPKAYPMGRVFRKVRRKKKLGQCTVLKTENVMYIPISDTVDKFINHPDYKRFVENGSFGNNSKFLDSYMKGEKCKSNRVLNEQPDALRFVLYYDDLEVCAPLKSKAGKHKLGAFYMFLDNIPPKFRSNLSSIFLVALVNANLIKGKKYGMDAALEHIVKDLKEFENGKVLKSGEKVYGTLIASIGDNLGSHGVGGFKEGFTANRPCRYCLATGEQVESLTVEMTNLLRTIDLHKKHCEKVQTVKGKNEKLSTEYGVNRDSILNILETFHVVGGLPPDLLHEILEGSLSLTIRKMLCYYLYEREGEKKFTLSWLNAAIRDFDFGYAEELDRPSELKKDHIQTGDNSTTLHQSACQVWLLATALPMILGPLIDLEDKYFLNFLDILEISRIVFSLDIAKFMVAYLQDLIQKYLEDYKSLYGHLIPKQHFLTHYPTQILLLGSLVNYMCLRCEAKHRTFKKLVEVIGNYVNVAFTLAKKHQWIQAVAWQKSLCQDPKCGPCQVLSTTDTEYKELISSDKVIESNWITHEGRKFKPGQCFICVGIDSESQPVFAKVLKVLIYPTVQFVCHKVTTVMNHVHFASYQIEVSDELCLHKPDDMNIHYVLHAHQVEGNLYIALKSCAGGALF